MFIQVRHKLSLLNTVAQENIAGNRVVKAFAAEEFEKEKFEERNEEFRDINLKTTYISVKFNPLISLLSQSLTITTLLVGGIFMINGELTPGEMLLFNSLTWALCNPLTNLAMIINDIQRLPASCQMVMEIFYAQPSIIDRSAAHALPERCKGDVEFQMFHFKSTAMLFWMISAFTSSPGRHSVLWALPAPEKPAWLIPWSAFMSRQAARYCWMVKIYRICICPTYIER